MYISSININSRIETKAKLNQKLAQPTFGSFRLKNDFIEIRQNQNFKKGLNKFKNLTLSEYKSLSDTEKIAMRNRILFTKPAEYSHFKDFTEQHDFASEAIKQNLDIEYGENNYTVIIIGRSLATIGKALGAKIGENRVKFLPMSGFNFISEIKQPSDYINFINAINSKYEKKDLKKFLEQNSLTKENIEKSEHKYIIMDYAYTGDSLKSAYALLTQDDILGNKNNNITYISINELLPEKQEISYKILSNLYHEYYKMYSHIGTSHYLTKNKLNNAIKYTSFYSNSQIEDMQLFIFSLFDEIFNNKERYANSNLLIDKNYSNYQKNKSKREAFKAICENAKEQYQNIK